VISKYRQWTAAILLLVYAFITTPVQLWHHHPSAKQSRVSESLSVKGYQLDSPAGISADDCPVCAHKYSAYTDYKSVLEIPAAVLNADIVPAFSSSIILSLSFYFSNKSPPVSA
jgi:hypothetical protein